MKTSPSVDTPAGDDADWVAAAKEALAQGDAVLAQRFDSDTGVDIDRLLSARAAAADAQVIAAWRRCIPEGSLLGLFAVGGYGRGELFPQSDIDLLVLADPATQAEHAESLARFLTLLWDAGLPVGHSVRSAAQCVEAATGDITVLTAMLEARPLMADEAARAALREVISPTVVWPAREFFIAKREEFRARHSRYGDTADNLEPNLKEGPGSLRDVQTLHWMALRIIGTSDLESLVAVGQLGADELATLETQRRTLSRLRFGLHLVAGKREERLRFDYQKLLAAHLGYVDSPDALAVEQMMQGFYRSASLVLRIGERLLQRFEEQIEGEATPEPIDTMFELRRGYLAASDTQWPDAPGDIFSLFAAW
ncbi:MAG: nucleotidyltransferase domain-containing protein, partial [Lysobacter sp.]|nr:nucleotidyltransferase domain-containing protein [Lysobacter sp.]